MTMSSPTRVATEALRRLDLIPHARPRSLAPSHPDRLCVLYDGDCTVSRQTVRQLRRWDHGHRLRFVPFSAAASSSRDLVRRVATERAAGAEVQVVNEHSGEILVGGSAALAILDALPGGWLLRPWTGLPTTSVAADLVYRLTNRHRDGVAWLVGMRDEVPCPLETESGAGERVDSVVS